MCNILSSYVHAQTHAYISTGSTRPRHCVGCATYTHAYLIYSIFAHSTHSRSGTNVGNMDSVTHTHTPRSGPIKCGVVSYAHNACIVSHCVPQRQRYRRIDWHSLCQGAASAPVIYTLCALRTETARTRYVANGGEGERILLEHALLGITQSSVGVEKNAARQDDGTVSNLPVMFLFRPVGGCVHSQNIIQTHAHTHTQLRQHSNHQHITA